MELEVFNALFGQQCVGLLFENRDFLCQWIIVVLIFNNVIISQFVGDGLGLAEMSAAIGAGIDLNQSNNVGIDGGYEADYPI